MFQFLFWSAETTRFPLLLLGLSVTFSALLDLVDLAPSPASYTTLACLNNQGSGREGLISNYQRTAAAEVGTALSVAEEDPGPSSVGTLEVELVEVVLLRAVGLWGCWRELD